MSIEDMNPEWNDIRMLAELANHLINMVAQRDKTIEELRAENLRLQRLANYN